MTQERVKKYVGGQAVIEGVMMRGPGYTATAVREPPVLSWCKRKPPRPFKSDILY